MNPDNLLEKLDAHIAELTRARDQAQAQYHKAGGALAYAQTLKAELVADVLPEPTDGPA